MTILPAVLASALVLSAPQDPAATRSTIVVEVADRRVTINAPDRAALEPHLTAHPQNARHLIAGVFLVKELGDPRKPDFVADMVCSALTSFDAGTTWIRHDFPDPSCADPWVAMLPGGGALFVGLGQKGLLVYRSDDGGEPGGMCR